MKIERWNTVSEIFQSALKLDGPDRGDYVQKACGGDLELQDQVRSLLNAFEAADDGTAFFDRTAAALTARLMLENDFKTGEIMGQYKILKRLGAGGMGEVYLAEDTTLGRLAAVKFLLAESAQEKERVARFLREARAASALNHPNILTIHQVGDHKGSRYIATEYIDGETLRDRLVNGALGLDEILDIASQIAVALDAAHSVGIVHRDIKPENIMIRNDGLVKVLDFGLAKITGQSAETAEIRVSGPESETVDQLNTRTGTIMGTAAYMSPEQACGHGVDARSDIWSLGVLIYEMATGQPPFRGPTPGDTIEIILKEDPALTDEIPEALGKIIERSLKKNRGERFQTVKELEAGLRELKGDLDLTARWEKGAAASTVTHDRAANPTRTLRRSTVSGLSEIAREISDHKVAAASGLLALIFAAVAVYYFVGGVEGRANSEPIRSIAVMPFVNGTGNAEIEYLSDGMTDSLINSLSKLPGLSVKARSWVFQYKGKTVSPQTIGKDLLVESALMGNVTRSNDDLTITLELVDTESGDRLWGESYTRKQADLASLSGDVTRAVANKLSVVTVGQDRLSVGTTDAEAYRIFLQGLYFLNKRSAEDIRKSIDLFETATQKDPSFAKAHAYLASAFITLRAYNAGLSHDEVQQLSAKANAAVLRARELDDSLPEVHSVLGTFSDMRWKFAEAEEEHKRAIELNPNDGAARSAYSLHLSFRGRHDEALEQVNRAYEIDPFSRSIAFNVGARYQEARRFDEAIVQLRRVLEMEPNHPLTHFVLANTLEAVGNYAEAIAERRIAEVLLEKSTPEIADRKAAALMRALNEGGARGYWRKRLEIDTEDYKNGKGMAYEVAIAYARLGESDKAFASLERSFANHELYLPWIRTQAAFDGMSHDPRFTELVARIGVYP